jgi:hypothetical protein
LGLAPNTLGKCVAYTCTVGGYTPQTIPDQEVTGVGNLCVGGCSAQPSTIKAGADGKLWATWPFKQNGEACGGAKVNDISTGETPRADAPVPCGANMCPGSVNGASVCVACKDTSVKGPSQSASGAAGAASGSTGGIDGVPGAASSQTETRCTGLDCTTTTTYRDNTGAVIGSKSDTKPQESFCKENAESPMCKKGTFAGSCAAAFACDGDGVQCAVALEIHKRNCTLMDTPTAMSTIGEQAANGEAMPTGHPGKTPSITNMDFAAGISQADVVGGGNCPVDYTFQMQGASYTIPFSSSCDKLQLVGNLLVGVTMLAAAFIVFRS